MTNTATKKLKTNTTKELKNCILYDYITFTSKIHTHLSILEVLGLEKCPFERFKGFYGYQDRIYYEGISVHYNGRGDMGICVEMSGKGCRAWEKFGNSDYNALFSLIIKNYDDDSTKRLMNITRLDVAYDDFNEVLDLPLLCMETQQNRYVSRFQDWDVHFGNKGISVNHGSSKSNVYIRIYDKKLEQKCEDLKHWVRCELQIRHECALGFIKLAEKTVDERYFMVLNNYLRYIIPTDNQSNNRMLDTAPYWLNFIESANSASIFCKPSIDYNMNHLYSFVNNQISGAIKTYIDIVGVPQFLSDINKSQKGKKLNPKYKALKEDLNANNNTILEFLAERNAI